MSSLEKAISIAALAHAGAVDKSGAPYILHPLRVMFAVNEPEAKIVAVLHDVLEDTDVDEVTLRAAGFSEAVLEGIRAVTKLPSEDIEGWDAYETFIRRAASNALGCAVKLADLHDNCDLSRISAPTERDFKRLAKYQRAVAILKDTTRENVSGG
jgi:(p)ppGpp synthase/HD superfamily hydrolase